MTPLCYTKLHRYKYQLAKPFGVQTGIKGHRATTEYMLLFPDGELTIKIGYRWDGPSGPTPDTKTFMRGALVHDALYQLIRMNILPVAFRKTADRILKVICIQDGMLRLRAWWVYIAVRLAGQGAAKSGTQKPDKNYCITGKE